jgi:hypothetical protein
MSPPSALAISTMTVAAPGEEPQTAVVPGSTLKRARRKPSVVAKTMTMPMQVMNIGHWRSISIRMSGLMLRATRQPTTPCAMTKDQAGISMRPSNHASRIPAPIDPKSNAAGRPSNSRTEIKTSDAPRSAHHCRGAGLPRSVKGDIGPQTLQKDTALVSATRAILGRTRRIEHSWDSTDRLVVASRAITSS